MDNKKDERIISNNDENNPVDSSLPQAVSEETHNPDRNSRIPFTNLSQIDADLALARTLQDQERAYMMLTMNEGESDHGSYLDDDDEDEFDQHDSEYDGFDAELEEDAFDVASREEDRGNRGTELNPDFFSNDEAYAQALQDVEDQEMDDRLRDHTDINGMVVEDEEDNMDENGDNYQDSWDDVDPDELSYEELIALGEVVGTESRGLSADSIASLRSVIYKTKNSQTGSSESCVICRLDYEDGDNLTLLSCKHSYHSECITNWLQINKVCPVCSTEVSISSTAS